MAIDPVYEHPDPELIRVVVELLRKRLSQRGVGICVSGIDGSGKTTLARNLIEMLNRAGLPARRMHLYKWYVNILVTPIVLFYNRYFGRRILVLDRGIYDNAAVMAVRFSCPLWLSDVITAAMRMFYPRVDYSFYLVAGFSETLKRRPETREGQFALLSATYERMMARVRHYRLCSNRHSFSVALRCMVLGRQLG